jgi:hypothetical protein
MKTLLLAIALALAPLAAAAQAAPLAPQDGVSLPYHRRITFPARNIFEPRSANLSAEGRTRLDDLAREAKSSDLEVMIAVEYGERSVERAAAVREYLLAANIPASRVYSEAQPRSGRSRLVIEVIGSR